MGIASSMPNTIVGIPPTAKPNRLFKTRREDRSLPAEGRSCWDGEYTSGQAKRGEKQREKKGLCVITGGNWRALWKQGLF